MEHQHPRSGAHRPGAEVYRRRRIAAAVALVVVAALVIWGIAALAGLLGGDRSASGTTPPEPGASAPAAPESPAPPADGGDGDGDAEGSPDEGSAAGCPPGDVTVEARTDQSSYGAQENPVLEMTIVNTGDASCALNVGTSQQEFTIVSGSDRIFSTSDCLAGATDVGVAVGPGQRETARFTWERVRSAPGCKEVAAKPRPGTYVFTAKLGDVASNKASFTLK
ncbi:hypothetical protein ACX8Z9_15825 [Arthrobacter halodurans]|uniref:DUF4232 domain-containing protein n=1 Tax=Arthrobacter halodurans TaxID=516699 RepID=A0ABV4UUQ1_9MICC